MKRKETRLEKNLKGLGYFLSHKTYTGKHSDKVYTYVYLKYNGDYEFSVLLNKTREQIVHYSFICNRTLEYNLGILEFLQAVHTKFKEELMSVYDFDNKCAYEITEIKDDPFIEESGFDD